jgi:hypothetical protein
LLAQLRRITAALAEGETQDDPGHDDV